MISLCSAELALEFFRIMTTAPPSSKETSSINVFIRYNETEVQDTTARRPQMKKVERKGKVA